MSADNAQSSAQDNEKKLPEPVPIRRLQQSLINRIAAGEIIHRPASALKELLENSLDAGATSIRVTVKNGGMTLLQIQDNGSGIQKSSLSILAHRHTTSKLSTFSDLSRLTTYGFRGEALASISHVANLSVITKVRGESCAWRACYVDGELASSKPGVSPDPKPFAGNVGTTITVENLFYNTPARLSALRSSSEEHARILDVVTRYAVHNSRVSFICKKSGSPSPDLSTPATETTQQAIRVLYGQSIAKDLLNLRVSPPSKGKEKEKAREDISLGKRKCIEQEEGAEDDEEGPHVEGNPKWTADVHFTNANYHAKKMVFLLFINHRMVESSRIKRAIEAVYMGILPKGSSPFVYLSLQLDPTTVDVNVHPTKREVHFLDEEAITEKVADAMQAKLSAMGERTFEYQTLLTGGIAPPPEPSRKGKERASEKVRTEPSLEDDDEDKAEEPRPSAPAKKKPVLSQHKVRTSVADRTLDSMFPVQGGRPTTNQALGGEKEKTKVIKESVCFLTSVQILRQRISKGKHKQLTEILEKHIFVGVVDLERELSLVQHSTRLYLVSHGALAEELFFQLGLRQFGNLPRLKLDPPPPLRELVALAVEAEEGTERSKMSKGQIVDAIVEMLIGRREMLVEYFSLSITADGLVEALPLILRDYTPNLDKLPLFLMRLGPQVNWNSEAECFESFLRELAYFYIPGPGPLPPSIPAPDASQESTDSDEKAEKWQIQHVLFPAMRKYLVAPKSLLSRDVVQVANLPDLYRVFERC